MIAVWSVLWGNKYGPERVYALRDMVNRHLPEDHVFYCLTDQKLELDTVKPAHPEWEGWWQKMQLFSAGMSVPDRNLYFDLDVIIKGDLRPYTEPVSLHMQRNWARSGHGGWQSSMMAWSPCDLTRGLYRDFDYQRDSAAFHGDQEYITAFGGDRVQEFTPTAVCSYKYHCREHGYAPDGIPVIAFHGKPDYWECGEEWIQNALL